MIMYESFKNRSVGLFRCSRVNQERPMELSILWGSFSPGHLWEFYLSLQLGVLGLQFC